MFASAMEAWNGIQAHGFQKYLELKSRPWILNEFLPTGVTSKTGYAVHTFPLNLGGVALKTGLYSEAIMTIGEIKAMREALNALEQLPEGRKLFTHMIDFFGHTPGMFFHAGVEGAKQRDVFRPYFFQEKFLKPLAGVASDKFGKIYAGHGTTGETFRLAQMTQLGVMRIVCKTLLSIDSFHVDMGLIARAERIVNYNDVAPAEWKDVQQQIFQESEKMVNANFDVMRKGGNYLYDWAELQFKTDLAYEYIQDFIIHFDTPSNPIKGNIDGAYVVKLSDEDYQAWLNLTEENASYVRISDFVNKKFKNARCSDPSVKQGDMVNAFNGYIEKGLKALQDWDWRDMFITGNPFIALLASGNINRIIELAIKELVAGDPERLQRLRTELETLRQDVPEFTYADVRKHKSKIPFLNAIYSEALRMRSAAQSAVRYCHDGMTLPQSGIVIPPRTNVMFPLKALLHDPTVYENPDSFSPERFLNDNNVLDERGRGRNIPFLAGPRKCPAGEDYGFVIFAAAIAELFEKYDVTIDNPATQLEHDGILSHYAEPITGTMKPRILLEAGVSQHRKSSVLDIEDTPVPMTFQRNKERSSGSEALQPEHSDGLNEVFYDSDGEKNTGAGDAAGDDAGLRRRKLSSGT